jgi:microcystin-dependent protein
MTELPVGTIVAYAGLSLPHRWLWCDGSEIDAGKYQELATLLNGVTPNLAGRTLIGAVSESGDLPTAGTQTDQRTPNFPSDFKPALSDTGGEWAHTLSLAEMPAHSHVLDYQFQLNGGCPGGSGVTPCSDSSQTNSTNTVGNSGAHYTMQPYYTVNYIVYGGSESTKG